MSRKNENIGKQMKYFILSCAIGLIAGISLVGWADNYPISWRYSMFLNAPNTIVVVSFLLAVCIVLPFHTWFAKHLQPPKENNINNGVYLLDFLLLVPLLFCATQTGIIINGALDKSKTKTFDTVVLSKREVHTMRANSRYIKVEDWYNPGNPIQISVSSSNYEAIQIGDSIKITTKGGFLGYEWMVSPDLMKGKWPFDLPDN